MTEIEIRSGSAKYSDIIGSELLKNAGKYIAAAHAPCSAALITDSNVDRLYADTVCDSLRASGFEVYKYVAAPGEGSKSPQVLWDILGFCAENGLGRGDIAIALGGGVVGDITGFACAIYMRGIGCVQLPTTLLAAVDSSIGGKTAIDLPQGKNLAGAFHQPLLTLCDVDTISTLPRDILAGGAAEVIKYGMLGGDGLLDISPERLYAESEAIIARCVRLKAKLVAADERDSAARRLLNFGHSFGHAMERLSGYAMPHGEAVARGMALVARASYALRLSAEDCLPAITKALGRFGLADGCPYPPEALASAMLSDKKRSGDSITLVLPRRPGECYLHEIDISSLEGFCRAGMGT